MRLEECAVIGGMQIWALDPHHLPPAVIRRWWKYLLFTREQPQLHQHCNQILSLSPRWCKNQQSSPKHPNRSSRVIPVSRRVPTFSFFPLGGVFMFLGIPLFLGSPPTAVGVPAMKAQRVPWVFSPPLTGHQINYPIYQREGKGPLPLSEIVFPNLFSNQTLADINLLISQMS